MSNLSRKLARNEMKKEQGNNRIKEKWHLKNSTLEEIIKEQQNEKSNKEMNKKWQKT